MPITCRHQELWKEVLELQWETGRAWRAKAHYLGLQIRGIHEREKTKGEREASPETATAVKCWLETKMFALRMVFSPGCHKSIIWLVIYKRSCALAGNTAECAENGRQACPSFF